MLLEQKNIGLDYSFPYGVADMKLKESYAKMMPYKELIFIMQSRDWIWKTFIEADLVMQIIGVQNQEYKKKNWDIVASVIRKPFVKHFVIKFT